MLVGTGEEPFTYEQKIAWTSMLFTGKIVYRVKGMGSTVCFLY